jgi:hypothetical protein
MRWNSQRQPKIQMTESYLLVIILIVIAEIFASEALYFFIFDLDCWSSQTTKNASENSLVAS